MANAGAVAAEEVKGAVATEAEDGSHAEAPETWAREAATSLSGCTVVKHGVTCQVHAGKASAPNKPTNEISDE